MVSVSHFILSSATHSSVYFCPILKDKVSKFKLRSCLINDTKVSDLSVLRTKICDFKFVYFLWGHPVFLYSTSSYSHKLSKRIQPVLIFRDILQVWYRMSLTNMTQCQCCWIQDFLIKFLTSHYLSKNLSGNGMNYSLTI